MKVNVQLPKIISAYDYHEFIDIQDRLLEFNFNLEYHELENISDVPRRKLYAVFFSTEETTQEQLENFLFEEGFKIND